MNLAFKLSEVGMIPTDWHTMPCSAISALITVGIVVRPKQYYANEGVPALRSANIREDGISDRDMVFISEKANSLLSKSQLRTGDVLTVRTGYPGTSAVVPPRFAGANCIDILITRPSKVVNSQYLAAWINSSLGKYQVLRTQGGLAQQHFNVGDLRNLIVALPPTVTEQDAIAEVLSDVDALIEFQSQLLAKKRRVAQAAMQELLTGNTRLPGFKQEWNSKPLGELADVLKGRGLSRGQISTGGGRPCILYGELFTTYGRVVITTVSRTDSNQGLPSVHGDVLMPGSTTTTGSDLATASAVLSDNIALGGDINVIRRRPDSYDPTFFAYYLTHARRDEIAEIAQGTTIHHLYGRHLKTLTVHLPELAEQVAIAGVLADMELEIAAVEARLNKTRQLRHGTMQELLTGRIRLA